jgi:hypothetical protein
MVAREDTPVHELKVWPCYYIPILRGDKPFELRKFDRDYKVGHVLRLREWLPTTKGYTGNFIYADVLSVLADVPEFGLMPGFCIMGIKPFREVTPEGERSL